MLAVPALNTRTLEACIATSDHSAGISDLMKLVQVTVRAPVMRLRHCVTTHCNRACDNGTTACKRSLSLSPCVCECVHVLFNSWWSSSAGQPCEQRGCGAASCRRKTVRTEDYYKSRAEMCCSFHYKTSSMQSERGEAVSSPPARFGSTACAPVRVAQRGHNVKPWHGFQRVGVSRQAHLTSCPAGSAGP